MNTQAKSSNSLTLNYGGGKLLALNTLRHFPQFTPHRIISCCGFFVSCLNCDFNVIYVINMTFNNLQ